jgi:taurine dioxygenase
MIDVAPPLNDLLEFAGEKTQMNFKLEPFERGFGAYVRGIDFSKPVSADTHDALIKAFADYHILSFPDQIGLGTDDVVAASRVFGPDMEPHVFKQYHHPDEPLVMVLSNRLKGSKPAGLKDAGTFWHSDVAYKPKPAKATMLYALEVPAQGGDTLFCDLTAAYDDLSDTMKQRLDGLKAWHFYAHQKRDLFENGQVESPPECLHPVVRTNPISGRKAIYITPSYTVRIDGMADDESAALMRQIFDHCLQDKYRMDYHWHAGDVLVWDNAAVMHSATTKDLDPAKHRTLWRTIISGGPTF